MRASEFINENERLDELLPLVVGAARGVAAGAKVLSKIGAAKKKSQQATGRVGDPMGAPAGAAPTQPAGAAVKADPQGQTNAPQSTVAPDQANPQQAAQIDRAKDQLIQPGKNIPLPTDVGIKNYKVGKIQGDEVEIENPAAKKNPTEPSKVIYKKDDLKRSLSL
jgi:hypothetical protein